ncbi:MAG: glycosyltransferase [Bryobacteraceae bacterium]|nr:glycosyltransferase [Bryobacteraceae bacterium]
MNNRLRIGYLISRYPAISHTFILREVLLLASCGIDVVPASINVPDRPDSGLTSEERTEAARTFYVKQAGAGEVLSALLWWLSRAPGDVIETLIWSLSLGGTDIRKLLYQAFYFAEALLVARWLRQNRLSHLHVHFATPAASVGMLAARLAGTTFSITIHGPDEFYDAPGYSLTEKIAACTFLPCIGNYARSQMMKLSPPEHWDRFEVTPLGVDPAQFAPRPFRPAPDPFEILCVGRLVPAKGQHVLVAAVARLRAEGRKVMLRFVGDGPDRASLERQAAALGLGTSVRFEGAVTQDVIREFYRSADVFALASFAEGIPVVLMEAMAMEVPCVTTWITGIPELIRDGVDGLLVAASDEAALAQAIARLQDDPELRRTIGAAGRQRVIDRYNLAPNVERLAAVYRRRLTGAKPAAKGHGA